MITAFLDPSAVTQALQVGFFAGLLGVYLLRMFFIRCKWVYVAAGVYAAIQWGAAKSIVTCIFTVCNALIIGDQTALIICAGVVGAVLALLLPCYKVRTLFVFGGRSEPRGQQLPANTAQQAQQVQQAQQAPAPVRNRRRGWSW